MSDPYLRATIRPPEARSLRRSLPKGQTVSDLVRGLLGLETREAAHKSGFRSRRSAQSKLKLRATAEEVESVRAAAEAAGMTVCDLIRTLLGFPRLHAGPTCGAPIGNTNRPRNLTR